MEMESLEETADFAPQTEVGPTTPEEDGKGVNGLMRRAFRTLGRFQGRRPLAFLLLTAVVASLSVGVTQLRLEDQIRDGYTPVNAPSQRETDIYKEFYGTDGDPQMSIVLVRARDGGSLLRDAHLTAVVEVADRLMNRLVVDLRQEGRHFLLPNTNASNDDNTTAAYEREDGDYLIYKNVCEPYCIINDIFEWFKDALDKQRRLLRNGKPLDADLKLDYPIAVIHGVKWYLARNFFGVQTENTSATSTPPDKDLATRILRQVDYNGMTNNNQTELQLPKSPLDAITNQTTPTPRAVVGVDNDTASSESSPTESFTSTATVAGDSATSSIDNVTTKLPPMTDVPTTEMSSDLGPVHPSDTMEEEELLRRVTSIRYIETFMLMFRADRNSKRRAQTLPLWEVAAFEHIKDDYTNPHISVMVVGMEVLNREMIRDGRKTTPFFTMGFIFMSAFVCMSVLLSALYYGDVDGGKLLVAFGTIISPVVAITTTFGLISLCGLRTNSIMLVTPFLVMAIGVDDAFLMVHSWERLAHRGDQTGPKSISERLGAVYEDIGPSILITSLTNTLAFGIGAFTPTPEIRLFCMTTAVAMALDFALEITLFGSFLALAGRCERRWGKRVAVAAGGFREKSQSVAKSLLRAYANLLARKSTAVAVVLALFCYWALAIYGVSSMNSKLDTQKILPKDSPLLEADAMMSNVVWKEYQPVTVMVNGRLDYRNGTQMRRLFAMVHEFEGAPDMIGATSTQLWLNDYKQYFAVSSAVVDMWGLDSVVYDDYYAYETDEPGEPVRPDADSVDLDLLEQFLQLPMFKHWTGMLRYEKAVDELSRPTVSRFVWVTAGRNSTTWDKRIAMMQQWRAIAADYADLNVTVWEPNGHFVDQMLSLKSVTVGTVLVTLATMAVVCTALIPSAVSVVCASLAIGSISLGVLGFLALSGTDLDPVVMAATLMSIGLSVDFTAHTSYHYQQTAACGGTIAQRLEDVLGSLGWPMIQAGISTIFCVLPLVFLRSYAPDVFLKTILLVVLLGLAHGLIVLPTVLAALPQRCCRCRHANTIEWPTDEERRLALQTAGIAPLGSRAYELQRLNTSVTDV